MGRWSNLSLSVRRFTDSSIWPHSNRLPSVARATTVTPRRKSRRTSGSLKRAGMLCQTYGPRQNALQSPSQNAFDARRGYATVDPVFAGSRALHRSFIALGSNVGDRIDMIEKACKIMGGLPDTTILRTSGLWETKPMYVEDQGNFLNGVCEVDTSLGPIELLDSLKRIESLLGRVKTVEKGPRYIDLDILLYDSENLEMPNLSIPHKLMLEREFVLRPLCQLIPNHRSQLPGLNLSFKEHLQKVSSETDIMSTLTPLRSGSSQITPLLPSRKTLVMSILNLSPDSFSDGGLNDARDLTAVKETVLSHIHAGATVIDIGGQSSRPHAKPISASEEQARVVPVIELIRSLPEARDVAISIDTYRAAVAEAAVKCGADIVNDISAGTIDSDMFSTVARLGCTVCLMHTRGTPETMTQLTQYNNVIQELGNELSDRVQAAERAGVRRWRIILDPGIGFAKKEEHNLEILRNLDVLRDFEGLSGLPWLVGPSRKGFIGKVTGVKTANQRTWGTAVAVAAGVQGGADIVRVHDVPEMVQVVKMSDAIWRRKYLQPGADTR